MMSSNSRSALISKLAISIPVEMLVFAALLFVPAGTLAWWHAWVFLGVFLAGTLGASIGILNANEDLLAERLKPASREWQPLDSVPLLTCSPA
jgi:uncharacterized membrane protein YbhN (UPF0104 family)